MSGEQKLKEGDEIVQTVESTNAAELLFFSSGHQVYKSKATDFADGKARLFASIIACFPVRFERGIIYYGCVWHNDDSKLLDGYPSDPMG
jgi:hypothetical protein